MTHQVCEERKIVELGKEVLGETMSKRMRIDNSCIDTVLFGKCLQLIRDTTGRDALAETIAEEISAGPRGLCDPFFGFSLKPLGDVKAS